MPDDRPLLTFDIDGVLCRPPFGLNPGENRDKSRTKTPGFDPLWPFERWRYLLRKPMPGASKGLTEAANRYEVALVSARGGAAARYTRNWLKRHFGLAQPIWLRPGPDESSAQFKVRALTDLAPLAHFEDDPHTARWVAEFVPLVFVVDWPRNRWLEGENIHRISVIAEAFPTIERYLAQPDAT